MDSERWQKVKGLFDVAIQLAPSEREKFLNKSCGADVELRREVEELLASSDEAESFMERPAAAEVVSQIIEPKNLAAGTNFGHYEIVRQIGAGGMGEVYLAKDTKLDRKVAVKILNEKFAAHESNLNRFIQEAKAASALNHPNILIIHEIGESENANYIVSEYIEGATLRDNFKKSPSKLSEVLDIAIQIANALCTAHEAHIVHRDIKPENIMLRPDGFVKILDFGLAKLVEQKAVGFEASTVKQNQTAKGVIMGTVNYMSPEQAKGEKVDARTDIFSFGVVLYEMIAGRTPFAGDSMSETFANLINSEPPPLARFSSNVPEELQRIVAKTLRKKRDERYQTMKDLLTDLKSLRENLAFDERLEKSHPPNDKNATAFLRATTGEANNRTDEANNNFTGQIKQHKSLAALVSAVLLFALIGFGYYFYNSKKSVSGANVKKSLAVLPFANVGQDPNAEYLSDGITESVINNLSQISSLRVMSRNSAFRFKNNQTDVKNIAAQLGVETLVTGDIKQLGDKLIINVRLINAADDSQIWGSQYVKSSADIIAAQNEIAQAVAQNLRVKLTDSEQQKIGKNYTANVEAYQLYLRGRFHTFKLTPPEINQGIAYFQQAIELDPNYALAYAGLSDAYRSLGIGSEMNPVENFAKSIVAARQAIAIDDNLSEGHTALGMSLFWGEWNWIEAEKQYKRALELNPNEVNAHIFYAHFLSNLGRHDEALNEIKRARELDPLFPFAGALEGLFLLQAGRTDEALDRLKKTFELAPNFWMPHLFASSVYTEKGMYAEAVAEAHKAQELSAANTYSIALESYALAKLGKRDEAQAVLDELVKLSKTRPIPATHFAIIYNGLGETDKALDWLEKAYEQRDPKMAFLKVSPIWNNLRSDARFIELMRRMNFESIAENTSNTATKFYWQMSDAEQLALIRERARHVQTLIGDEPTEFDEEALRAIKTEIDDYVEEKDNLSQKPFEEGLRVIYGRASQYAPLVIRSYETRQVAPALGLYQAMIESEYHDCLVSPTGPVGLFQFSRKTAAIYGLTEKDYCNVEKQADAAARLMSDLTSDFGSGKSSATLGLLGFNNGANGVREYLRQLRGRGVSERSFWTIFRYRQDLQPPLSDETKEYVPRFFAVAVIGETPEVFELSTPPLTTLRGKSK